MADLAFIGTGLLGSGMVENLLRRGHTVTVWNRTEAKARQLEAFGAVVASAPEEAVATAERVHLALVDDRTVDAMVDRLARALRPRTLVIDHTTNLPAATRERLPRLQQQNIRYLHAPVFMSPQMCREAKGIMLVSGAQADYEAASAALAEMTGHVSYMGERPDLAAAYKLFGNSMLFVLTGGISDVFALARGSGVDPRDAIKLFEKFPVGNMIAGRGAQMAAGDFEASFELTMARKDMRLMLETAKGLPLAVLPGVAARMDAAIAAGHGSDDVGVIAKELIGE